MPLREVFVWAVAPACQPSQRDASQEDSARRTPHRHPERDPLKRVGHCPPLLRTPGANPTSMPRPGFRQRMKGSYALIYAHRLGRHIETTPWRRSFSRLRLRLSAGAFAQSARYFLMLRFGALRPISSRWRMASECESLPMDFAHLSMRFPRSFGMLAAAALSGKPPLCDVTLSANSTSWRMAWERVGASVCLSRHSSIAVSVCSGQRMPICVPIPVAGRPRVFLVPFILDLLILIWYQKVEPKARLAPRLRP
jgi:hypothetical protein